VRRIQELGQVWSGATLHKSRAYCNQKRPGPGERPKF